jgi:hypothetical protein
MIQASTSTSYATTAHGAGAWVAFTDNIFVQSDDPTTTPSTAASVTAGDLWVETDQVADYPVIYRRNTGDTAWVLIDNADQTTPDGIVFADARANPAQGLTLDGDAPDPLLFPGGTLLFNTRYSGRNVKVWTQDATTLEARRRQCTSRDNHFERRCPQRHNLLQLDRCTGLHRSYRRDAISKR